MRRSHTDVGHRCARFELGHHAGQRRNPGRVQAGFVGRSEEALRALEYAVFVLAPQHAAARSKRFGDAGWSRVAVTNSW